MRSHTDALAAAIRRRYGVPVSGLALVPKGEDAYALVGAERRVFVHARGGPPRHAPCRGAAATPGGGRRCPPGTRALRRIGCRGVMRVPALMERLAGHCDKERVTVFWSCSDHVLCTTGRIVEVCDDFIVVHGETPTAAETRTCKCTDLATERLPVVILAHHICGIVFNVPECRKAALPVCCACSDEGRDVRHGGGRPCPCEHSGPGADRGQAADGGQAADAGGH